MGLFGKLSEKRMKDPVEGILRVTGATMANPDATSENYRIDGVLTADGLDPTVVVHRGMTSTSHWPTPGDALPVTFDRAKPEHLVIHWDRVPTGRQRAGDQAEALAERLRGGATGDPVTTTSSTTTINVGNLDLGGDLAAQLQAALGPAGMTGAGTPPAAPAPVVSAADILARGAAGVASITAVMPSAEPASKPAHTMVGLSLTVMVPGQPVASVSNLYGVPNAKLGALTVGMTLPVKVDPAMPGAVAIDWDAVAG